jgi:hypothetical protein
MFHPWNPRMVQIVAGCTKGSTAREKHQVVEVERDSIEVVGHCAVHRAQGMQPYRTEVHTASVVVHLEKEKSLAWAKKSVTVHAALPPATVCSGAVQPVLLSGQMPQGSESPWLQLGSTEDTAQTKAPRQARRHKRS